MSDLDDMPPIIGKRLGKPVVDESEHFMNCGACGQAFDMRDLSQVFYHEEPDHKPLPRS